MTELYRESNTEEFSCSEDTKKMNVFPLDIGDKPLLWKCPWQLTQMADPESQP